MRAETELEESERRVVPAACYSWLSESVDPDYSCTDDFGHFCVLLD